MNKKGILSKIKDLYENGDNIISYLKTIEKSDENSSEDIMISYDFQAGGYIRNYYKYTASFNDRAKKIAGYINELKGDTFSIFEAGVGEATTLVPMLNFCSKQFDWVGGVDLSWSRIKCAQNFAKKELKRNIQPELFVGDMFNLPLRDSSVDIVYTVHAMEPNGGKERPLLEELYRVAKSYVVLIEPSYELADEIGKARMEKNGYIKYLGRHCEELGYKIIRREPFVIDTNPLNPAEVIIICKDDMGDGVDKARV